MTSPVGSPQSGDLPVVDIVPFLTGDAAAQQAVADRWDNVFATVGFGLITGYQAIVSRPPPSPVRPGRVALGCAAHSLRSSQAASLSSAHDRP